SSDVRRSICRDLTLLLAPFAPYTAQDLWETLGETGPAFRQPWPKFDPQLAEQDEIEIPVQVNGKLRGHIRVAPGTPKEQLEQLARENAKVKPFLEGKQVVKVITVFDRLVNIVVK
ncbi:MAG TPA: class I tRNA ligase family protein, partial [Bryobacteraceae bacterium]